MPTIEINLSPLLQQVRAFKASADSDFETEMVSPGKKKARVDLMSLTAQIKEFDRLVNDALQKALVGLEEKARENILDSIKKSPAFYVATSPFLFVEHMKNAYDATLENDPTQVQLHLYIQFDSENVNCLFVDNGKGFSEFFNSTENRQKAIDPNTAFADFRKIIDPEFNLSIGDFNAITSIGSDKAKSKSEADEKIQAGGQGKGLAMMTKILHRVTNGKATIEVGNAADLSSTGRAAEFGIPEENLPEKGGVILMRSPTFTPELFQNYVLNEKLKFRQNKEHLKYYENDSSIAKITTTDSIFDKKQSYELSYLEYAGVVPSAWQRTKKWMNQGLPSSKLRRGFFASPTSTSSQSSAGSELFSPSTSSDLTSPSASELSSLGGDLKSPASTTYLSENEVTLEEDDSIGKQFGKKLILKVNDDDGEDTPGSSPKSSP